MGQFLYGEGRGAEEPHASLDHPGRSRPGVLGKAWGAASGHAEEPRGPGALLLWPGIGQPLRLLERRRESWPGDVCGPSPAPATHWRTAPVPPSLCRGRYEGPEKFLGRRDTQSGRCTRGCSAERPSRSVWCRHVGAPRDGKEDGTRGQGQTPLGLSTAEKIGKIRS